ncbi:MAG: hypothetical protein H6865_07540 [Rhodospirillales bacterium]|nr:hypothetical protein [Alphaproteobacteria bacterium]MCB9987467.1 hypothetical protein [Rhodospirillales bacterium]USO07554.1 MAG: hypothetical protein H6866_09115 [Rhodospirillales bacterium]
MASKGRFENPKPAWQKLDAHGAARILKIEGGSPRQQKATHDFYRRLIALHNALADVARQCEMHQDAMSLPDILINFTGPECNARNDRYINAYRMIGDAVETHGMKIFCAYQAAVRQYNRDSITWFSRLYRHEGTSGYTTFTLDIPFHDMIHARCLDVPVDRDGATLSTEKIATAAYYRLKPRKNIDSERPDYERVYQRNVLLPSDFKRRTIAQQGGYLKRELHDFFPYSAAMQTYLQIEAVAHVARQSGIWRLIPRFTF